MPKPDFLARVTPAMKQEIDELKESLAAEIPASWHEPTYGDLVAALAVLLRDAKIRSKLVAGLETYYGEKRG
jgi:hypothetical protein